MSKLLIILIAFTTIYSSEFYTNKHISGLYESNAITKIKKIDSGYILSLISRSTTIDSFHITILKLNDQKDIIKSKSFEFDGYDHYSSLKDLAIIDDYIYLAILVVDKNDRCKIILKKLNLELELVDDTTLLDDRAKELSLNIEDDNQFIYLTGSIDRLPTPVNPYVPSFPYLIKMDKELNKIDSIRGDESNYYIRDAKKYVGSILTTGRNDYNALSYIRLYDDNFSLLDENQLNDGYGQFNSILKRDDHYILTGSYFQHNKMVLASAIISKIDNQLNIVNEQIFGTHNADTPIGILELDNKLISYGLYDFDIFSNNLYNAGISIFDDNLEEIDTYLFSEDPDPSGFYSGVVTDENRILLVGVYNYKGWLFETDLEGNFNPNVTVSIDEETNINSPNLLRNYPNPFNSTTNIIFDAKSRGIGSIKLYNSSGEIVETISNLYLIKGENRFTVNLANNPSGIYYCILEVDNSSHSLKLVYIK